MVMTSKNTEIMFEALGEAGRHKHQMTSVGTEMIPLAGRADAASGLGWPPRSLSLRRGWLTMRPAGPPAPPPYDYHPPPQPELYDWPPWNQHTHYIPLDPGQKCSCNSRPARFFLRHPIASALIKWHVGYIDGLARVVIVTRREATAKGQVGRK
jgi:hypothetical protein